MCGALLLSGAVLLLLFLNGAFLPKWIRWQEKTCVMASTADVTLRRRHVTITENGAVTYTAPRTWFISDILLCDLDRDGADELLFLTWKRGSYGGAKPFWVRRDEISFSQHIFIFRYADHTLTPLWMSSAIGIDVSGWSADEEGRLHLTDTSGHETVWYWDYFGLKLLS